MKKSNNSWPVANELTKWYGSPLGQRLLALEQQQLDQLLAQVFGYYAVTLGPLAPLNIDQCSVLNKIEFAAQWCAKSRASAIIDFAELPFAQQSIDLFILPHVLEFATSPEKILSEISHCLIAQGSVLILGFNARSLFGLWHWLQGKTNAYPWRGEFLSLRRLRHLLHQTGFEIDECHTFYFRPPFLHPEALKKLKFLEVLGPLLWSQAGAGYAILAHKQESCLTPIRLFKKVEQPVKELVAVHREKI